MFILKLDYDTSLRVDAAQNVSNNNINILAQVEISRTAMSLIALSNEINIKIKLHFVEFNSVLQIIKKMLTCKKHQ